MSSTLPRDGATPPAAPDGRLAAAMREHQQGNVAFAEREYVAVLAEHPDDANAAHLLGMLQFQAGKTEDGLALVRRSVDRDPLNSHAWNNLGNMLVAMNRNTEGEAAYERAIALDERLVSAWYNLSRIHRRMGHYDRAILALRTVTRISYGFAGALQTLAHIYYRLGRSRDARAVYRQWAEEVPDDPTPRHMLAAGADADIPDRADDRFIVQTFDECAEDFDERLESLGYRAPELLAATLMRHPLYLSGRAAVLDAGCGTGWCGPLLRATAGRLTGVDLSPKMLDLARARGVYDELHEAELTAFLGARATPFDIIVSADVLCYFGRLNEFLRAARSALAPEGLLCFSVEASAEPAGDDFRLEPHGRYSHAASYLERALGAAGFAHPEIEGVVLRHELDAPVRGYVVAAGAG